MTQKKGRYETRLKGYYEVKGEISFLILRGELLDEEQFELGKEFGLFTCPDDTPYSKFKRTYYEDDERHGYLHIIDGKIHPAIVKEEDGKTTLYIFGIGRERVKPEFLREDQKDLW